jgi:hypothetical protein
MISARVRMMTSFLVLRGRREWAAERARLRWPE